MVYVDQDGNRLDSVDLNAGYLVDKEWIDHPARSRRGHYSYKRNQSGGVVQTYVVDQEALGAYREVTVQTFVPYEQPAVMRRTTDITPVGAYVLKGV